MRLTENMTLPAPTMAIWAVSSPSISGYALMEPEIPSYHFPNGHVIGAFPLTLATLIAFPRAFHRLEHYFLHETIWRSYRHLSLLPYGGIKSIF